MAWRFIDVFDAAQSRTASNLDSFIGNGHFGRKHVEKMETTEIFIQTRI